MKNDQKKLKNQLKEIAPLRLADLKKEQQEKLDRAKEKFQQETSLDIDRLTPKQLSGITALNPELPEQLATLEKQQQTIDQLPAPEFHLFDRSENPGYSEFKDNADRISSLASVFPWIFFLIAALVTLTTMTRMVEEKRNELGTFKALGYHNGEIAENICSMLHWQVAAEHY